MKRPFHDVQGKLCGCCEGLEKLTPMTIANRPGLNALAYRVGTHATFLETMKARLTDLYLEVPPEEEGGEKRRIYPLRALTTREANDPAIALLDAWATVADVLTFYQEWVANEGYLRTATERRSILELARLVGYRLRPGVAASVYLAFTLEKGYKGEIPAGTRAQSLPGPGEVPQPFETSEPLKARAEWNELKPRMTRPQNIRSGGYIPSNTVYLTGTNTNLELNALLLLDFGNTAQELYQVDEVVPDPSSDRTEVRIRPWQRIDTQVTVSDDSQVEEDCISLDYRLAEVEKVGGRWKIVVGNMLLLDFGNNQAEAHQALHIIKHYRMNQQCFVGRPDPSMEYYLVNGEAPTGSLEGEDCVGFNPDKIEVKQIGGRWKIVEGSHWIMDFEEKENEAREAFDIIRQYGFEYICFVGRPNPSMTYFRRSCKEEDCISFDYRLAEVKKVGGRWKIAVGNMLLLDFGDNETEAHQALHIIKHYRMNQQCFVGRPDPSMEYYLVDGEAPTGSLEGEDCVGFNPDKIEVKQIGGRWKIVEGSHWIMDFDDKEDEARQALQIIKKYGFEYVCFVGRPDPSMTYFRLDKESGLGSLIEPLMKQPSLQPANRFRLRRDIETVLGKRSDIVPQLLTTFHPALKGTIYQAWSQARVPETAELKSIEAFRVKAAPFGHQAPLKVQFEAVNGDDEPNGGDKLVVIGYTEWDLAEKERNVLCLDAQYDQILPGSWVIIERPDDPYPDQLPIYEVETVQTVSRADYGITGRVTQLTLKRDWLSDNDRKLSVLRKTTVYALSESLTKEGFAEEPIEDDVEGDTIELVELYGGLETGRWIIVSGERTDIPDDSGVGAREAVMIAGVDDGVDESLFDDKRHTTLKLANALSYKYERDTVTIYGNVVTSTHGETREEVLGSGDGSKALQQFALKQSPLTYLAAPTPAGAESTLELRVNDVLWHEKDRLVGLGPKDRAYITRTDDEDKTTITFGDGQHGARLPTGVENVEAVYRTGIGKPGNVAAEQISLLATRPLGVKGVVNPLPATGGADRESRDQARRNAPMALMALDRLISLRDYADFARVYAGIGKASAARLSDGRRQVIHVTIAGADDILIAEHSDLYRNLCQALHQFGDPYQPIQVDVRELMLLVIDARVRLLPDYQWESVEPEIRTALLEAFSFDHRDLGQDVLLSEVISVIQEVPGVAYVDVDTLGGIPEKVPDTNGERRILSPEEIIERVAELVEQSKERGKPLSRIPVNLTDLENGIIRPAQLAYLTPAVNDTLILTELT